jgi:hypothetical protein
MEHSIPASHAIVPITAFAAENGYKVIYDGGSIQDVKTGSDLRLFIESDRIRFTKDKKDLITIPASSVTEISYGQDVHRRVGAAIGLAVVSFGIGALMALTKSKKHFVGLTWADGEHKGGFAIQCDKSDYRGVLAGIEGITGKKAVDTTQGCVDRGLRSGYYFLKFLKRFGQRSFMVRFGFDRPVN